MGANPQLPTPGRGATAAGNGPSWEGGDCSPAAWPLRGWAAAGRVFLVKVNSQLLVAAVVVTRGVSSLVTVALGRP